MALPLHHHQDRYRSAPGTPYIDPRSISAHDMETAFQQARFGLGGADYFPDSPRFDGVPMPLRPRSPYTQGVGRFDSEFGGSRDFEVSLSEHIRKTNLAVALANSQISSRAKFSLLHPMVASDGRFSEDFNVPKTVESVKLFDSTQLDRVLQFYRLPFDRRSLPGGGRQVRHEKLQVLFEHLGATRIVEHGDLIKRQPWM